jgi:hypothetical protein
MRAFSFGGGVQSTAALILAAQGRIAYDVFLFSNVGNDSEDPDTLDYYHHVAMEYAEANNIRLYMIRRTTNGGETLYQRTLRQTRSIKIPVRMKNGSPGVRSCTQDYKRSVIAQWLRNHSKDKDHIVGLGISMDEIHRMRTDSGYKHIINEYPLIDLRLNRKDCLRIIREAELPQPPKSSCWFCPFRNMDTWHEMRRKRPELFIKAVELENLLNQKRAALGRDPVYLSAKGQPLDRVVGLQYTFIEDDVCESGFCMT